MTKILKKRNKIGQDHIKYQFIKQGENSISTKKILLIINEMDNFELKKIE